MENYEFPQIDEMIEEEPEIEEDSTEESGPFDGLLNYFDQALKEEDAKGFVDIYKRATENFFALMQNHYKEEGLSFTPLDVSYGDGYFIFIHGTNSVVHFHLKEAPGWLFGIWWSPIKKDSHTDTEFVEYDNERIYCEFFGQYEEEIDKFKPADSTFVEEFDWWLDKDAGNYYGACQGESVTRLIMTEPILAWYREYYGTDYNSCYITKEHAQEAFTEYKLRKNQCELIDRENTQKMLDCLTYIFKPLIDKDDAFIHDQGSNVSPRYELIIRNYWKDDMKQEDSQDGLYDLFDFGAEWEDKEEDKALWKRTIAECETHADAIKHYWFNPVSRCVYILSGERYWNLKKKSEEEKED